MQKGKEEAHAQPGRDELEADTMPCCIHVTTAPATPAQSHAWACLWHMLLMEDIDHNGRPARGSEGETHEK